MDENTQLFVISIAAELAGMHPQTLRQYDRLGLVVPGRTQGGSRRYSLRHVKQLREVAALSAEGMSLPAISRLIELENEARGLRRRVAELEQRLQEELARRSRVFAAGATGSVVTLRHGTRVRRATEVVLWRPLPAADADPEQ